MQSEIIFLYSASFALIIIGIGFFIYLTEIRITEIFEFIKWIIEKCVKFCYFIYKNINKYEILLTLLSEGKTKKAIKLLQNNRHLALKKDRQGWNLYDTAVAFQNIEFVKFLKSFTDLKHTQAYIAYLESKVPKLRLPFSGTDRSLIAIDNGKSQKLLYDAKNNASLGII